MLGYRTRREITPTDPKGPPLSVTAQKLGGRLRQLRHATGKSQAEVAIELGVSRSTIAQIELGARTREEIVMPRRRKRAANRRADQPAMPGDEYP